MLTVVEIEINTHCNRRCNYCPNSILPSIDPPRYMNDEIFQRILNELERIKFDGRLSYHFYNEPLLRMDIEHLVEQVSKKLPRAYQALYTNGDHLSDERYSRLRKAGIAHFIITRHDYKTIPGRDLQTVLTPDNIKLTNRGGILDKIFGIDSIALSFPCYAPDEMLIVTVNGLVLLCYEDAKRTQVFGNIMENTLDEIWYSDKFVRVRRLLAQGKRNEASEICRKCTNQAHTAIGTSFFAL